MRKIDPKVLSIVHYVLIDEMISNTRRRNQSRFNDVNPLSITRKHATEVCKLQGTTGSYIKLRMMS